MYWTPYLLEVDFFEHLETFNIIRKKSARRIEKRKDILFKLKKEFFYPPKNFPPNHRSCVRIKIPQKGIAKILNKLSFHILTSRVPA